MTQPSSAPGLTGLGKFITFLLVAGVIGIGVWVAMRSWNKPVDAPVAQNQAAPANTPPLASLDTSDLAETRTEIPALAAPVAYVPQNNTIDIELSEYAGYAGLIAANGGLAPSENSVFFKRGGFKVNLRISEEESWSALNAGKMAASATTVDVLAVYGRRFNVVVPAQIGFSRGADGIVVRSDIKRINNLKGRILAATQFTESDFFIRYLAQEAGIGINMLPDLRGNPDPGKINLVYCKDGEAAASLFNKDLAAGSNRLAGCVTWAPFTTDAVAQSNGKATLLTTNRNLLVIADILIVNKGFAEQNPDKVQTLVQGLLEGNRMVRDNPEPYLDLLGRAFKWDRAKTQAELAKVHLANLPENRAFFNGTIASAGSFPSIFQSAVLAYSDVQHDPVDADRFVNLAALTAVEKTGEFKDQQVAIAPLQTTRAGTLESDPLLSKDIRFYFLPNQTVLDLNNADNLKNLDAIKRLLTVSPGSSVQLRGHVDNAKISDFRQQGGEKRVREMALLAMQMSKDRAAEIKRLLVERQGIAANRIETVGRGWEEPVSTNSDENRRVEVQWFTLE